VHYPKASEHIRLLNAMYKWVYPEPLYLCYAILLLYNWGEKMSLHFPLGGCELVDWSGVCETDSLAGMPDCPEERKVLVLMT